MSSSFLSDRKIFVFGLMVACPQKMPLKDCPLEKYRKLANKEKLNHLEKFSDEKTEEIFQHHHHCLLRRLSNLN